MRILWITPVGAHSAIAFFSELVVERLVANGCDVSVAASESAFDERDRRRFFDLPIVSASRSLVLAETYDLIVANFGDHFPNHALSIEALDRPLVLGIFHDADMSNFANGMRAAQSVTSGNARLPIVANDITREIASRCSGAVAHSRYYLNKLDGCDGPLAMIPLAWSVSPSAKNAGRQGAFNVPRSELFKVVTIGNINANKCPERVIEALGTSEILRERSEYRLAGDVAPAIADALRAQAQRLGVELVVCGRVSDIDMRAELLTADVVSCLREPVLEGASASAIEAMMQGCAVVVSDVGFYADLPDNCVAKVPARTDVGSIRVALEALYSDPNAVIEMGKRAQTYATGWFSPQRYALQLLKLIADIRTTSAFHPVIERTGRELRALSLPGDCASVTYVLEQLEGLASVRRRSPVSSRLPTPS
ncbi:MAG: glycosyltransferase family 4 protein [Planctomycetales bacterium]|nr:glycosyltransferase family 4 protein [Planctomycetales bacterium]